MHQDFWVLWAKEKNMGYAYRGWCLWKGFPSQLTRFRNRVGSERLEEIMRDLLEELVEGGIIERESLAVREQPAQFRAC